MRERRYVDIDQLEVDQAPMMGTNGGGPRPLGGPRAAGAVEQIGVPDYRALDLVCEQKDVIERHVYRRVCDLTKQQLILAGYDLTSSNLEVDRASDNRFPSQAFGYSRDGRVDRPQVVIGLLTSRDGIPIAHRVFAGATNEHRQPRKRCWRTSPAGSRAGGSVWSPTVR